MKRVFSIIGLSVVMAIAGVCAPRGVSIARMSKGLSVPKVSSKSIAIKTFKPSSQSLFDYGVSKGLYTPPVFTTTVYDTITKTKPTIAMQEHYFVYYCDSCKVIRWYKLLTLPEKDSIAPTKPYHKCPHGHKIFINGKKRYSK